MGYKKISDLSLSVDNGSEIVLIHGDPVTMIIYWFLWVLVINSFDQCPLQSFIYIVVFCFQ